MRIDEIRRARCEAGKNELKDALDSLIADGKIMKNKKNRFAVSAHTMAAWQAPTLLPSVHSALSHPT